MNEDVRADLESRDIFDPSSLDYAPAIDGALLRNLPIDLDPEAGDDVTVCYGRARPRMPWEVKP
jgi:hypothetical protein